MSKLAVPKPAFVHNLNRYEFFWESLGITAKLERIDDEGKGEIALYHRNGSGDKLLLYKDINLLSMLSCGQITKQLNKSTEEIDWDTVLTYITHLTLEDLRKGKPLAHIGLEPPSMKVEYLLRPILQKGLPTTLFAPGGSGKSYIADYIAVLVQCNVTGLDGLWVPESGNVLYLDWESDDIDHKRRVWAIKQGLKLQDVMIGNETYFYQQMDRPLIDCISIVQQLVIDNMISLVIIDSHMAAQDNGIDQSQVSSRFYNALRSLNCTSLSIDHVNKTDWNGSNETVAPYGSVVKYNRSRAQFQLIKSQNSGDDFLELSLKNHKNNQGRLIRPFGIRVDFCNNDNDELLWVKFKPCDVKDNTELANKTLTVWERIELAIKENNRGMGLSVKELAQVLNTTEGNVRSALNEHKDKHFMKKGELWVNIAHNLDSVGLA